MNKQFCHSIQIFAKLTLLTQLFLVLPLMSMEYGSISGKVVDSNTGDPLFGVNIYVKTTLTGASTDESGKFLIERIPPGSYDLLVSRIGYKTQIFRNVSVILNREINITINLQETAVELDPVIISAEKHPQSMSSSHQDAEVISAARINKMQYSRLYKSLGTISGVHFNEQNISIRGSSGYSVFNVGSRILLMIDGIPVNSSDLGAVNWDIIPVLDIHHIEVVKGAGSALYGSSALGGVVNIITNTPSRKGRLRIRTRAGIYDKPAYKEWEWTKKILNFEDINLAYSRQTGPVSLNFSFSRYLSTGYMDNNHTDRWNAALRMQTKFSNQSRLDLYVSWMKSREGGFLQWINQNSPFEVPPFNKDDEINFSTLSFSLRYSLPLSSKFCLKFRTSMLNTHMGNQLTSYNPGAFKPSFGPGAEIQLDYLPDKYNHIIFGSEYRSDFSSSEYFGNHNGYTLSAYLQDKCTLLSCLTASLGLRIDSHTLDSAAPVAQVSPKAGINFKPFRKTTVRASAGSGFRAATVFEKYIRADYSGFNIIPNPDLKPERSWFWDIGVIQNISANSTVKAAFFYSEYKNMIEPVIDFLGTIQFKNRVRARITGIEFSNKIWFLNELAGIESALTYLNTENLATHENLPYRPNFTAMILASLKLKEIILQAEYKYASRIEEVEINPLDPRVPVKLLNFRASYHFNRFTISMSLNNALNYHYTQIERRMQEVRTFSVGVQFDSGG